MRGRDHPPRTHHLHHMRRTHPPRTHHTHMSSKKRARTRRLRTVRKPNSPRAHPHVKVRRHSPRDPADTNIRHATLYTKHVHTLVAKQRTIHSRLDPASQAQRTKARLQPVRPHRARTGKRIGRIRTDRTPPREDKKHPATSGAHRSQRTDTKHHTHLPIQTKRKQNRPQRKTYYPRRRRHNLRRNTPRSRPHTARGRRTPHRRFHDRESMKTFVT